MGIRSPKLQPGPKSAAFYKYYAGYSLDFVEDLLDVLSIEEDAVVADPWNGSGTTTFVASKRGYESVGFDINPALVLITKARLVGHDVLKSVESLTGELLEMAHQPVDDRELEGTEPLLAWFDESTSRNFRSIERAIFKALINRDEYEALAKAASLTHVSRLASFFYAALFDTVRGRLKVYGTSNPTWIKVSKTIEERLTVARRDIENAFEASVATLADKARAASPPDLEFGDDVLVDLGNSEELPLKDGAIGAVVTSPPYCTRIDYAVATLPELATLGYAPKSAELKALRDKMLGTPTLVDGELEFCEGWGPTCRKFVEGVTAHKSRASDSYYRRYYLQYFDSLHTSLGEIDRCLCDDGTCAVVVQDSYYKEIHNDLPRMVREMAESLGWRLEKRVDYPQSKTKAAINARSREYRQDFSAVESLLVFRA